MQKIVTFLWFDKEAEEAANFYVSIFRNSRITKISRYSDAGPSPAGSVMTVDFELDGQQFTAMNAGPQFPFTEAISLMVKCETQAEVDYYWEKLVAGGKPVQCGWLRDRYGLSWQVTPNVLLDYMSDADVEKATRTARAMFKMQKLDIAALTAAYEGR